jgi:lactate permease
LDFASRTAICRQPGLLLYFIVLAYFHNDPNLVNATVVNGALSALTPISIIWAAILLPQTMRRSGAEHIVS